MFGKGIMIQKILVQDTTVKGVCIFLSVLIALCVIGIISAFIVKKFEKIAPIIVGVSIITAIISSLALYFYIDECKENAPIIGYEFINCNEYINLDYYIKPDGTCVAFLEGNPNIREFTYNNLYIINQEYDRKVVGEKEIMNFKKLEKICSRQECLRYGQLMNNFIYWLETQKHKDIFYLTDEEFIYYLEMYVGKIVEV